MALDDPERVLQRSAHFNSPLLLICLSFDGFSAISSHLDTIIPVRLQPGIAAIAAHRIFLAVQQFLHQGDVSGVSCHTFPRAGTAQIRQIIIGCPSSSGASLYRVHRPYFLSNEFGAIMIVASKIFPPCRFLLWRERYAFPQLTSLLDDANLRNLAGSAPSFPFTAHFTRRLLALAVVLRIAKVQLHRNCSAELLRGRQIRT